MARIYTVKKSRKERTCGKCREDIPVGSTYFTAAPGFRGRDLFRCAKFECRFRPSDLTKSKLASVYAAQEGAQDALAEWTHEDGKDALEQIVTDVADAAREVADEYREAAEAMGEAGAELEERADELEGWADDLEAFDVDEAPTEEDADDDDLEELLETWAEEARNEAEDLVGNCPL